MGYTQHTFDLVDNAIALINAKSMIDLGAQNNYAQSNLPAPFVRETYNKNLSYASIDLSGEDGALPLDLSVGIDIGKVHDLVVDAGTSEHIGKGGKFDWKAYYNCWLNKHHLLKVGGIMVNENPKTGNWPGHGFNYVSQEFYQELVSLSGYELIDLHEHPAMHNTTDGWNVVAVMKKVSEKFPSFEQFKKLPLKKS